MTTTITIEKTNILESKFFAHNVLLDKPMEYIFRDCIFRNDLIIGPFAKTVNLLNCEVRGLIINDYHKPVTIHDDMLTSKYSHTKSDHDINLVKTPDGKVTWTIKSGAQAVVDNTIDMSTITPGKMYPVSSLLSHQNKKNIELSDSLCGHKRKSETIESESSTLLARPIKIPRLHVTEEIHKYPVFCTPEMIYDGCKILRTFNDQQYVIQIPRSSRTGDICLRINSGHSTIIFFVQEIWAPNFSREDYNLVMLNPWTLSKRDFDVGKITIEFLPGKKIELSIRDIINECCTWAGKGTSIHLRHYSRIIGRGLCTKTVCECSDQRTCQCPHGDLFILFSLDLLSFFPQTKTNYFAILD